MDIAQTCWSVLYYSLQEDAANPPQDSQESFSLEMFLEISFSGYFHAIVKGGKILSETFDKISSWIL